MRVLLATRGSEHSALAAQFLNELAMVGQIQLTVLTVLRGNEPASSAEAIFAEVEQLIHDPIDLKATRTRLGDPASEIIAEAESGQYDLLVMGKRTTHSLVTRIRGSVTRQVLMHMPCAVLIAKGTITPIDQFLLCESGRQKPTLIERLAITLPEFLHAEATVTILHVMSQMSAGPGVAGKQLRADAEELIQASTVEGKILDRDVNLLANTPLDPQPKVRHGFVVDEIVDEASRGEYDLIVIGAHQYGRWDKLLLDNLARQIVEQSGRPILVVP